MYWAVLTLCGCAALPQYETPTQPGRKFEFYFSWKEMPSGVLVYFWKGKELGEGRVALDDLFAKLDKVPMGNTVYYYPKIWPTKLILTGNSTYPDHRLYPPPFDPHDKRFAEICNRNGIIICGSDTDENGVYIPSQGFEY
jgi:hypothetical protein